MATDAATTIAESLKETDELPRKQIGEIVQVLGPEVALELLAETRRVQDLGGVAVRDGTRRRTDGGVFFSLAKAKLPKPDRNRIFRIRPPKAEGAPSSEREIATAAGAPVERAPRPVPQAPREAPQVQSTGALPGRRRMVEVEVLRHPARAVAPLRNFAAEAREAVPTPRPEPPPPREEARPLRRIVVAAPKEEPPPTTVEGARDRIRPLLGGLGAVDKRRVLAELLLEMGGEPVAKRVAPSPPPAPPAAAVDDKLKEKVLAAVTDALGLSAGDLARALYGDETPGTRSKARVVIERHRKSSQ